MAQTTTSETRAISGVCYASACALFVAGCAWGFGEPMGTHRLAIHLMSVVLVTAYCIAVKVSGGGDVLAQVGLIVRGRCARWALALLVLGALSGALRYALYRQTGLGGVKLYERELVAILAGSSAGERALRALAFFLGAYVAVLVPSALFLGVIQERFSRAGWFLAGLLVQSAVFGLVHSYMTGSFDALYGGEAFLGAVVTGLAYERVKNVYVPALFMSSNVFVATVLLAQVG